MCQCLENPRCQREADAWDFLWSGGGKYSIHLAKKYIHLRKADWWE